MDKAEVICSFQKKCKNYGKMCHCCKWNASIEFGDHLLIEENGRSLRFL